MKNTLTTIAALMAASINSQAAITLVNADFELGGDGAGNASADVSGWTEGNSTGGLERFFTQDSGRAGDTYDSGIVVNVQARNGTYIEQQFSAGEATTGDFASYTVSFDIGWRNNTSAPNDLKIKFQLWNFTTDAEISSSTYTISPNSPSNASDDHRLVEANASFLLADTSATAGQNIGLRLTAETSQNSFNPTGWVDNISVTETVPEPSSTALIGLASLSFILRRRR